MNKTELIKEVAKKTSIDQNTVREVLNSTFGTIFEKLIFGMDVKISGFVNFSKEPMKRTKFRDPQTGETIIVKKRFKIKTSFSRPFLERIKNQTVY